MPAAWVTSTLSVSWDFWTFPLISIPVDGQWVWVTETGKAGLRCPCASLGYWWAPTRGAQPEHAPMESDCHSTSSVPQKCQHASNRKQHSVLCHLQTLSGASPTWPFGWLKHFLLPTFAFLFNFFMFSICILNTVVVNQTSLFSDFMSPFDSAICFPARSATDHKADLFFRSHTLPVMRTYSNCVKGKLNRSNDSVQADVASVRSMHHSICTSQRFPRKPVFCTPAYPKWACITYLLLHLLDLDNIL